ncbi:MAG: hypothetical protein ABI462_08560 [Ignavibacteria bacterium]
MKSFKCFLAAIAILTFTFPAGSFSNEISKNSTIVQKILAEDPSADITYVEVDLDGVIYIFVYDGLTLIDVYPE